MIEPAADFGTGLRAHLGLERAQLDLVAEADAAPAELASEIVAAAAAEPESAALEALAALEYELLERERIVAQREASLAARAGTLLAAAQALHDEVLGRAPATDDDELARMRRRKSGS